MRVAFASTVCLGALLLLLFIRGAADWSDAFAFLWYGLFGLAVLLALIALGMAFQARSGRERVMIVAMSLPALAAVPVFVVIISTLAPLAN
jgi:hypothetical protein